jgi:tetratricopeptide (TPR) repeat protein
MCKPRFNVDQFFQDFDNLVNSYPPTQTVEEFFGHAMESAAASPQPASAELTVLNEQMGFFRSRSEHEKSTAAAEKALALLDALPSGATDTTAADTAAVTVTTLINAATAYRAAHAYDESLPLYQKALALVASGDAILPKRTVASLHNNLSILYSDTGKPEKALAELEDALKILESEKDPELAHGLIEEIGSTHSNMALVLLGLNRRDDAVRHAKAAYQIYTDNGFDTTTPHFASILSTLAQCEALSGDTEQAHRHYSQALAIIEQAYGKSSDQYAVVSANLSALIPRPAPQQASQSTSTKPTFHSGLEISRKYWEQFGKPLLHEKYPQLESRVAAGLVGHGSERYGFDDEISRDHDFRPGFCWWLTPADYKEFGEQLQADYDQLPNEFMGLKADAHAQTPRSQGAQKRVGVFSIPKFFESITGLEQAPDEAADDNLLWLSLDEPTLAAATNGEIFADPLGKFSAARQMFKQMPEDVRLSLISRRLGMIAQAGQYNFPRMMGRGDAQAARLCLSEFAQATISLVFLVNFPMVAGYMPYYKWQFAALRKLSRRMGMRLTDICEPLEEAMDNGVRNPHETENSIGQIAQLIVRELLEQGMTQISDDFLEWHRPYVEELISDPRLKSL